MLKFMDASSTTIAFIQLFIVWTLLSVLLVWIFLFIFLALRPDREKGVEEPTTVFTIQPPIAQSTMSPPIHAHRYEPVSEPAPLV
jgi:hypothetical protein